ncbi:MAG TPA: glycosyltransferase [Phycisphaerae bacterium]|nr:glycosyltransferase [Phycisphaerae bacterium]HNU44394.1 glycosyltransferase [Phycisphaerae bacterium]
MILVTVGTQFFDELIDQVDRLVATGKITDHVHAQIGLARRTPTHLEWVRFDRELMEKAKQADLVITHGGTGCVCELILLGRPMIAVANSTKSGNHQLEFLRKVGEACDLCWIASPRELEAALPHARAARPPRSSSVRNLAQDLRDHVSARRRGSVATACRAAPVCAACFPVAPAATPRP